MTNRELAQTIDTSESWIEERTGILSRHIAADHEATSDLSLKAAQAALADAGVQSSQVDLIIVATSTPDRVFPSSACLLQAKLGATGGAAFDLQAVCTGFIYAITTADAMIRAGVANTALVVGADTFSRLVDWNDRSTCILFGDGAGAVVIAESSRPGIRGAALHADGSRAGMLTVNGQICQGRVRGGTGYLTMDGRAVFRAAVDALYEAANEVLDTSRAKVTDVDFVIPHQANLRIIQALQRRLDVPPERMVVTVSHHGNTAAASVPLALDHAVRSGTIRSGHQVLLDSVGAGFTWGATLLEM